MGASKKIMELFLSRLGDKISISSARFANVAFSNGSLLEGFKYRFEKKQPLVMPPDFEKLPIPDQNLTDNQQENINQIKELIVTDNTKNTNSNISSDSNKKTENFILDKIKK